MSELVIDQLGGGLAYSSAGWQAAGRGVQPAYPWVLQRLEQQGKAAGVAGIRLHPDPEPADAGLKPTGWF